MYETESGTITITTNSSDVICSTCPVCGETTNTAGNCPSGCQGCKLTITAPSVPLGDPEAEPLKFPSIWSPGRHWPGATPHKCPVCDGTGLVSRPPHIAGDVDQWTDSGGGPYSCKPCGGAGILWG